MVIPEHYAQVNLIFQGEAVPRGAQLTFGIDNTVHDSTPSDVAAIAAVAWGDTLSTVTLDTLTLAAVKVKEGPNDTGPEGTFPQNDPGSQSAAAESPQVALIVTKQSLLGGKKNRGRWFLPAVRESYVDDAGNVDGAGGAAIQAQLDAFLAALADADVPMVILHNDPLDAPTPVTALALTSKAGTQRRRLRKVGGRRKAP